MASSSGYLGFMKLSGCGACEAFEEKHLHSLKQSLPYGTNYLKFTFGQYNQPFPQEYDNLNQLKREYYPMFIYSKKPLGYALPSEISVYNGYLDAASVAEWVHGLSGVASANKLATQSNHEVLWPSQKFNTTILKKSTY